jgi:hypothetical protein
MVGEFLSIFISLKKHVFLLVLVVFDCFMWLLFGESYLLVRGLCFLLQMGFNRLLYLDPVVHCLVERSVGCVLVCVHLFTVRSSVLSWF